MKLSPAPYFDLDEEHKMQHFLMDAIEKGVIASAHDCADGGLFVTLFESASVNGLGFDIASNSEVRKDAFLLEKVRVG